MKFNAKQLRDAITHMGYDINDAGDSVVVDVELITEDPGKGELVECMRISVSYTKPPSHYNKSSTHLTKSLEIYADSVKKKPQYAETKHTEVL
jgi:hypothetical protein